MLGHRDVTPSLQGWRKLAVGNSSVSVMDEELVSYLQLAVKSLSYTVCVDVHQHFLPGYQSGGGTGNGFDFLQPLGHLADSIRYSLASFSVLDRVKELVKVALIGNCRYSSDFKNRNLNENQDAQMLFTNNLTSLGSGNWISSRHPLLVKPLFDYFVLALVSGADFNSLESVWAQCQLMSIAYLCQLVLVAVVTSSDDSGNFSYPLYRNSSTATASTDNTEYVDIGSFQIYPFMNELTRLVVTILVDRIGFNCKYSDYSLHLSDTMLRDIAWRWFSFLVAAAHLMSRVSVLTSTQCDEVVAHILLTYESFPLKSCECPYDLTDKALMTAMKALKLDVVLIPQSSDDINVVITGALIACRLWLDDLFESFTVDRRIDSDTIRIVIGHTCRLVGDATYPVCASPQLHPLSDSYTNLHALVSSCQPAYEFPVICMTCGAVGDVKTKGNCRAHSSICSGDAGLFFLVQVSNFHYSATALLYSFLLMWVGLFVVVDVW